MSLTRIPTQKRSIEKRNKIIEKGFELMCENGFYNTTTNDIAKYADVSTGIIYQYFNDKKEIFLEGVKNYANNIMYPMLNVLDTEKIDVNNLDILLNNMIKLFIERHNISKRAHEELVAMEHLDNDVAMIFKESELNVTNKIAVILRNNNLIVKNDKEKIHIIIGVVDNLCHEIVYHKHKELNYDIMIQEVVNLIKSMIL